MKINRSQLEHKLGHRQSLKAFTLLELLIVVGILAIIGGALITAYDGLQSQAAKATATNTIASVDQAVRNYTAFYKTAPTEFDSLVAAVPTLNGTNDAAASVTGGTLFGSDGLEPDLADGTDAGGLGEKLAAKLAVTTLSADFVNSLIGAGITSLRYIDSVGNNQTGGDLITKAAGGGTATVGALRNLDIPNLAFDTPRPGASRNRGRGINFPFAAGASVPVATWKPGTGGIDNLKVGAAADDVLIAFGLGNNATIIGGDDQTSVGNVSLSTAPFYADVKKNEYGRYVLLYNVGSVTNPRAKAKLQAVVDARGDFLDEEFAESTGQKQ